MCGIAGVARLDGQSLGPESDVLLSRLADILQHRGPDDRELMRGASVGLAFTRLSLVDPADGTQPLVSADGTIALIANGEVYNYRELAARLPAGVRLKTAAPSLDLATVAVADDCGTSRSRHAHQPGPTWRSGAHLAPLRQAIGGHEVRVVGSRPGV